MPLTPERKAALRAELDELWGLRKSKPKVATEDGQNVGNAKPHVSRADPNFDPDPNAELIALLEKSDPDKITKTIINGEVVKIRVEDYITHLRHEGAEQKRLHLDTSNKMKLGIEDNGRELTGFWSMNPDGSRTYTQVKDDYRSIPSEYDPFN